MIDPSIKIPEIKAGFDAMSYFKDMTEKNKLASEYGFTTVACSGPFSLEGLLLNFKNKTNFIAIDDTNEGNVFASDGGFFKNVTYTVWILARYKFNDMNDRQVKLNLCRVIYRQFLTRILKDKYKWQLDFTYLLGSNIDTRELGVYFVNGLTGIEFHLDIQTPLDLTYNNDEWK